MQNSDPKIKAEFHRYLQETTQKYILVIFGITILIISGFAISDLLFRENTYAALTRLIPLSVAIPLWFFQLFNRTNCTSLKFKIYNLASALILVMMYAKYLIYINIGGAGYSVSGIIVVIFLISLDLKANMRNSLIAFLLPTIVFTIILFLIADIDKAKIVNLTNVYPMVLLGLVLNRVQYNLRFKLFLSNYLLNQEKQTTKLLYEKTKNFNEDLQQKNEEIEVQNQAIEEKNTQLEEMLITKDKFFSIISHDLKSAFNAMIGFSKLLKNNYKELDEDEKESYISNISNSIDSSYRLLENLLLWAQSQHNDKNMVIENHNLFLLAQEAIDNISQTATAKNIEINNTIAPDIQVQVDKNYLETIFRNLINNAIKFSHQNSSISVSHELKYLNSTKAHYVLCIEDRGLGMDENRINKLFDLSQKVSTKGTNNEIGTGLGLILCKEFIEKMNGQIWVESKLNEGSKFYFSIKS